MSRVVVIAEAGVNHDGCLDKAKALVEAAAQAGADVVKFQTFSAEKIVSKFADKAEYQKQTTDGAQTQLEMLKKLELSKDDFIEIKNCCEKNKIQFMSTAFDVDSLWDLSDLLQWLKLPSGEVTNVQLLYEAGKTKLPIILSTGMSKIPEIKQALGAYLYGYQGGEAPSLKEFEDTFNLAGCSEVLQKQVTVLHCTTEYPAPFDSVNLRAMKTLKEEFGVEVGYSDHTEGISVSIAAVALGAKVVEKHMTLDRSAEGPDHKASIEPDEFSLMVKSIREVEKALGSSEKAPAEAELKNISIARKSLVARTLISEGDLFSPENLTVKRPGDGVSPTLYFDWIGKRAKKSYEVDEVIKD